MEIKLAAAAVKGTSHIFSGLPCQDRAGCIRKNGVGVLALSDGAGSCPCSQETAEQAVQWTLKQLPERFDEWYELAKTAPEEMKRSFVQEIQTALGQCGIEPADGYCTLLLFGVHEDGRWLAGHIGDGIILIQEAETPMQLLSGPENGEYKNETFFINEPEDVAAAHFRIHTGMANLPLRVLISSDGCEHLLVDWETRAAAPAAEIIGGWLAGHSEQEVAAALEQNLQAQFSQNSDDDLSLAVLYCRGQIFEDKMKTETETENDFH